MPTWTLFPPALLVACSAPIGWSQDLDPQPVNPEQIVSPMTGGLSALAAGTLATMAPDAQPDLFGLRDGELFRAHEPGLFNSTVLVSASVLDLATAVGVEQVHGTDGIVTVGGEGVLVWTTDPATDLLEATVVDQGDVSGIQVECADVLGDGTPEIVVLDADSSSFRVYTRTSAWELAGTISFPTLAVLDFDLAELDSDDPGAELVIANDDGVRGYALTPPAGGATEFQTALVLSRTSPAFTLNQVETLRDHVAIGVDGFAWVCYVAPLGRWVLHSGYKDLQVAQYPYYLPADAEVRSLSAGRIDYHPLAGPGSDVANRDDVAVSFVDSDEVFFFVNRGHLASKPFDVSEVGGDTYSGLMKSPDPGKFVVGQPVIGDLDGNLVGEIALGLLPASGAGNEDLWLAYDVSDDSSLELGGGGGVARPVFDFALEPWDPANPTVLTPDWLVDESAGPASGAALFGSIETDQAVPSITLSLWMQAEQSMAFDPMGTGTCETTIGGSQPVGLHMLSASVQQPALTGGSSSEPVFDEEGRVLALRARPTSALPDGSRPERWLVLQGVSALQGSVLDWSQNSFLELSSGSVPSRMQRSTPPSNDPFLGVGIIVETLPPKRITPPPGGPPPRPGPPSCPSS